MPLKPVDTAITVIVGPLIDDTDFKTREVAVAYNAAGMDVDLIVEKADGTTAKTDITLTTAGANDWTHKGNGYYEVEITAAQNTEKGVLRVVGFCTGVLPFGSPAYDVVPTMVYNSLVQGTDKLEVDQVQLGGSTQSATDLKHFADTGYNPATSKVQGVLLVDTCTTNSDMVSEPLDAAGIQAAVGLASGNLDTQIGAVPTVSEFNARTLVAASYATSTEVTSIQNNTRAVRVVAAIMERPDSGSAAFRIELLLYDETGNMEAPDSAPTIDVVNQAGSDRTANLDATTMSLVSTGRYRSTYTVSDAHAIEQLVVTFSVVEGGKTRAYGNAAQVVDTTAVDFTAADRTTLGTIATDAARLTDARATVLTEWIDGGRLDLLLDLVLGDTAELQTRLGDMIEADGGGWRYKANALENVFAVDMDQVEDAAPVHSLCCVVLQQAVKSNTTVNAGFLTVFETDGTTEFVQLPLSTDPDAEAVDGIG